MRKSILALCVRTSVLAMAAGASTLACAQDVEAEQEDPSVATDIVVTGTQIRGIEPVGSSVVSQNREQIEALGVTDTRQVLAQLPQSNFFLDVPQPGGGVIAAGTLRVPIARASLRNIPGLNSSTGQRTLVLIDGKRIVPAGIEQQGVDLGIIPQGIIERTEVILDGASAVYGSDAVEGVINLITRKRFNGTEVSGRYGIADDYWQADAGITQGFAWDTGGITLTYEFAKNSNILNRDRDFTAPLNYIDFNPPQVDDPTCAVANVRRQGTQGVFYSHHVEGTRVVAGPAYCASNEYETLTPAQELHSGFATFSQDITDWLKFEASGFYTHKTATANTGPFIATSTVAPTAYYYGIYNTGGAPTGAGLPQQVGYNFSSVFGNAAGISRTTLKVWQFNPELIAEAGGGWQVRLSGGTGRSTVDVFQERLDAVRLGALVNGTTAAAAVNAYNVGATQNAALLPGLKRQVENVGEFRFAQVRLVADGPLFTLPGGEVRVAVGGEWTNTKAYRLTMDENFFTFRPITRAGDKVSSLFGEVNVPLVGDENASPGLYRLALSGSGRYDKYDGFETFNPKFAITYQPAEWITLRGNWGKSFRAPNAVDKMGMIATTLRNVGAIQNPTNVDPRYNFAANSGNAGFRFLFLQGTDVNLRPEKATNWSLGLDIEPPFIPGMRLSATYWNIAFKDAIQPPTSGALITPAFLIPNTPTRLCFAPPAVQGQQNQTTPTFPGQATGPLCNAAQLAEFLALSPDGPGAYASVVTSGGVVAAFVDSRISNLGEVNVEGIDASLNYSGDVSFGSMDTSVSLAVPLKVEQSFYAGGPIIDELNRGNIAPFTLTASVGATAGNLRGQVTMRHRAAYKPTNEVVRLASQTKIDSFTVFDLALRYTLPGGSWITDDVDISLNVNNVLDAHPPLSFTAAGGTHANGGSTLGRLFMFGISKKFGGAD